MTGRAPPGAAFEPTALAPTRRRVDPVLIASLVVVLGIGAAVMKPWAAGSDSMPGTASETLAPIPPTTRPDAPPLVPPDGGVAVPAPIAWTRVAPVVQPHGDWGVRAIVYGQAAAEDPSSAAPRGTTVLVERWRKTVPGPDGSRRVLLQTADQGVLLLGITHPHDDLPLDVRIWARTVDGWRWLDAEPVGTAPAAGAFLFGPPREGDRTLPTWPTGSYLVEVLTGTGIRHIRVSLPDRFEVVPGPDPASPASGAPLAHTHVPSLASITAVGPFLVEGAVAIELEATPAVADAADRWRIGNASIHASRGNGLGVLLPAGAQDVTATLHRIAPVAAALDAPRALGVRLTGGAPSPYLIFHAPNGTPWSPGMYRIQADWTLDGEPVAGAWDLELRPGPKVTGSSLLHAARRLATAAGPGDVVGHVGSSPRVVDLRCPDDRVVLDEPPTVIGLGHSVGAPPASVSARLMLGAGRTVEVPILVAREAWPGLTIMVPAVDRPFSNGAYRLDLQGQEAPATRIVCLGVVDVE